MSSFEITLELLSDAHYLHNLMDLLRHCRRVRARPAVEGSSSLALFHLCFTLIIPLSSLCFWSLAIRIFVVNEPRARISATVEKRLFWSPDAVSCRGYGPRGGALARSRLGSGSIAALVRCGVWFSPSGTGNPSLSSGSPPSTVESKTTLRLFCFRGESRLGAVLVVPDLYSRLWLPMARAGVSSRVPHSRLWLFQALFGASLVFPASSSRHQFETFTSFAAASLLEPSSCAFFVRFTLDTSGLFVMHILRFFGSRRRQEASRVCHSVAVSLLGSVTIPVLVKGRLTRHW
ncbi:hypothetical protein Bca52824_034577 [Brassica carinata]|uniref:Uncharacterized protein n=1 Tax=Brassica carinata TaxID=52824 RepID=A0A8X7S3J2_BRACI|nr:hypothetical protein Bca52824_034577 [Brassica carinata]